MKTKKFTFQTLIPVDSYQEPGTNHPAKGSTELEDLFELCKNDTMAAYRMGIEDLVSAGIHRSLIQDMIFTAEFDKFDSPNSLHANGYFNITVEGDIEGIKFIKTKWKEYMDS